MLLDAIDKRDGAGMAAQHHPIELRVSEFFFRLTTECLRVRSNEVLCPQNVGELVGHLLTLSGKDLPPSEVTVIRDHLETIPSYGDVPLIFALDGAAAGRLANVMQALSGSLGTPVSQADAISVLMLEYIAGKKAVSILQKLGIVSDRPLH